MWFNRQYKSRTVNTTLKCHETVRTAVDVAFRALNTLRKLMNKTQEF